MCLGLVMNAPTARGPLFWILVAGGVAFGCCLFSGLALAVLGSGDDTPSAPASASGGAWIPAGEVARGATLTQQLPGGRWVYQSGGSVDTVVARSGATQWVQSNTSGSLYSFTFDDDGTYSFEWASAVTLYGATSRSSCLERGDWSLEGTQLTLVPRSQQATYVSSAGLSQTKEDEDLTARTYQVVDITLEGIAAAGAPAGRFPGIELAGPGAKFDVSRERYELDLQRL
jgi:hypothetical protein